MSVTNFCKPGMMSECTGGKTWKTQTLCFFSDISSESKRCMYFVMDKFCDCLKAQQAEYNPITATQKFDGSRVRILENTEYEKLVSRKIARNDPPVNHKKKICTIDGSSICSQAWCSHWQWCKEPIKNR